MTSIAEHLTNPASVAGATNPTGRCLLGTILERLDDTDRDAVLDRITRPGADEALSVALTRGGHRVASCTVRRHRVAVCRCQAPA